MKRAPSVETSTRPRRLWDPSIVVPETRRIPPHRTHGPLERSTDGQEPDCLRSGVKLIASGVRHTQVPPPSRPTPRTAKVDP